MYTMKMSVSTKLTILWFAIFVYLYGAYLINQKLLKAQTENTLVHRTERQSTESPKEAKTYQEIPTTSQTAKPVKQTETSDPCYRAYSTDFTDKLVDAPRFRWPSKEESDRLYREFACTFPEEGVYICGIPKTGYTHFRSLYCAQNFNITGDIETISGFENIHLGRCKTAHNQKNIQESIPKRDMDAKQRMVMTRDPIDRLISAYMFMCHPSSFVRRELRERTCYDCTEDFDCFLRNNSVFLQELSDEEAEYKDQNGMQLHFFPQSWFCDFLYRQEKARRFEVIHFPTEQKSCFGQVMRERLIGLDFKNNTNLQALFKATTRHTNSDIDTAAQLKILLLNSPELFQIFYETYEVDYHLFGFDVPAEVKRFCKTDPTLSWCS